MTTPAVPWHQRPLLQHLIAPAVFAALTLTMFRELLFQSARLVSSQDTDLTLQFVSWRAFGFSQLRHGHLPLWNPYIYGGTPYFAGFQSSLLYPLNWLHLVLPLYVAINWIVIIHVFLAGYFTSLWARGRGAGVAGSIIAGVMFMFGGTYFLHVFAGHLPHLCLMVWLPLLFLTIEKLACTGSLRWCWLGIILMSMIILAGHPQYVYYTGIITLLYTSLLLSSAPSKRRLLGGYIIVMVGACLLTAVQLFSGMQAAGESVRSGGTSYEFASMFALPPENLLTFLIPHFFGTLKTIADPTPAVSYFGRCYLWEMSVFVGITGFVLANFALIAGWRRHWRMTVIIAISLALALGKHLPIYRPLFDYLPMYGSFRDVAKFTVFLTLFLSVLAADGYELLLARRHSRAWFIFPAAIGALAIVVFSWAFLVGTESSAWHSLIDIIRDSQESYVPIQRFLTAPFSTNASEAAMHATSAAGIVLLLIAAIVVATRFWRPAALALVALAIGEMFVAARQSYTSSVGQVPIPEGWIKPIEQTLGDGRVINAALPGGGEIQFLNQGMSLAYRNVWGYDPGVLKRYAELLASSQGINPDQASQYLVMQQGKPGILQLLRCKLVLIIADGQAKTISMSNSLPRAQLVKGWALSSHRDDTLAAINAPSFDPRHIVLLESVPSILPASNAPTGPIEVTDIDTDTMQLQTTLNAPALLLITENYSTGWSATSMDTTGTSQRGYDILPADHAMMAIPLDVGTHHIRLHYRPLAFTIGAAISMLATITYLTAGAATVRQLARQRRPNMRPVAAEFD